MLIFFHLSKTSSPVANPRIILHGQMSCTFNRAQNKLMSNCTVVLPRHDDQLWIVTDGSVKNHGIGAALFVTREGKPLLAGYFSAKLRGHQVTWLPCEVEALSIAVGGNNFSPYIIQSKHKVCILTDSKSCVQTLEKQCRGELSASPRLSTYLSFVSCHQASVKHGQRPFRFRKS